MRREPKLMALFLEGHRFRSRMSDGGRPPEVGVQTQTSNRPGAAVVQKAVVVLCQEHVSERDAMSEMKEGPSESVCRSRLQTAVSCFGQKPRWLTLRSKDVTNHVMYGFERRAQANHRRRIERLKMTSKPELHYCSGISLAVTSVRLPRIFFCSVLLP